MPRRWAVLCLAAALCLTHAAGAGVGAAGVGGATDRAGAGGADDGAEARATTAGFGARADDGSDRAGRRAPTAASGGNGLAAGAQAFGPAPEWFPPERGFVSGRPAVKWEDALLSGNGTLGALVMGEPVHETVVFSHERIYMPLHEPLPPPDTASRLPEIRRLLSEGRYQQAADLVVSISEKEGYGGKRWTDPFIPAADLRVDMAPVGRVRDYRRGVDFSTGVAVVQWRDDRGLFLRRLFVSRADGLAVMAIAGPAPGSVSCRIGLGRHPADPWDAYWADYWETEEKFRDAFRETRTGRDGDVLTFEAAFGLGPGGYEAAARVVVTGGSAAPAAGEGEIAVTGADEVLVLVDVRPLADASKSALGLMTTRLRGSAAGFDERLARHEKIHGGIFGRVRLDLNGGEERLQPVERLIARARSGEMPMALLEKVFDAGRYNILSSCGELPPNLQGVWGATWGASWSGDYTLNANVQAAVAGLEAGHMPEAMESLFRLAEEFREASRTNAQRLYGARGLLLASRASTHGLNNHFDRTWPMTFWTAGAAWLAHFYYDHWLFTGDRTFLRERAVPYMKDAALFYEDFLVEGPDGKLLFSPSYSPENNPGNSESQACVNATMDVAAARELLTNLVAACRTLGIEREGVARWQAMLAKLPDYVVNADGTIREWSTPLLEDNPRHRHASHLYPLFAAVEADLDAMPALRENWKRTLDVRWRDNDPANYQPFGLTQMLLAAARLGEARTAWEILECLARNFFFRGLASSHFGGANGPEIFNMDASGGLPAGLIDMLVFSRPGRIGLLPAAPAELPAGEITGVRCRGGVEIVRLRWSALRVEAVLRADKAQTVALTLPREIKAVQAFPASTRIRPGADARSRAVALPGGRDVVLQIAF